METVNTMEQIIAAMEKAGWRLSNLSHINGPNVWSAILERKKVGEDGFAVYASSGLVDNPRIALAEAWAHAQKPLENNPRVSPRPAANGKPKPEPTLEDFLIDQIGLRIRLEDAFKALGKAYGAECAEAEDEYL